MAAKRTYLAIDLKSFYASVECVDRHLDPLITNLVVADASRTEKTICLAVSPSLKTYKIPGRARHFLKPCSVSKKSMRSDCKTLSGTKRPCMVRTVNIILRVCPLMQMR